MKQETYFTLIVLALCTVCSCTTITPVMNSYEKAGTLGQGNVELMGAYTRYSAAYEGESESVNDNYGFRVGYGLSNRFDLKFRYERLVPSYREDGDPYGVNYFSVVPKVALVPKKFSLLVPLSRYSYTEVVEGQKEKYHINSIASQFLYTYTNPKNTVDLSMGAKVDFTYSTDDYEYLNDIFIGASIGAGFSSNLDKWAIRPEVGIMTSSLSSGYYLSYGVAMQVALPTRKKAL